MTPLLIAVPVGVVLLGLLAASSTSSPSPTVPPGAQVSQALQGARPLPQVPGVHEKPGVVYSSAMLPFLTRLRAAVPQQTPIVVTSGVRTVRAQAKALLRKRQLGDDLSRIYRRGHGPEIVRALLAVPAQVEPMAQVLQFYVDQGIYMSRHMRGDAIDLRSRGLSAEQIQSIQQAAQAQGARVLVESTPPHIHIERIA